MSYRTRIDKKIEKQEKTYEINQLMKEKWTDEDRQSMEEVFDRSTLMIIYHMLNQGALNEIHGVVRSGKEAKVYWGKDKDGKELAVKIYLVTSSEFRKGMVKYIDGDPRFRGVKHDTRSLVYAWAQKEYKNLELARFAEVPAPHPLVVKNNVLIMDFIGKNGTSAPLLKEKPPRNPKKFYSQLLDSMQKLYCKAGLVHGDLSEYNIMVYEDSPILFDMSQAVLLAHPMANELLIRDLTNLNKYFSKQGVGVVPVEQALKKVTNGASS